MPFEIALYDWNVSPILRLGSQAGCQFLSLPFLLDDKGGGGWSQSSLISVMERRLGATPSLRYSQTYISGMKIELRGGVLFSSALEKVSPLIFHVRVSNVMSQSL